MKCSPEQLRLRTSEEREADRFLVRDLRAAAASLYPEVGFSPHTQKNFTDLTGEERPPGDLLSPGMEQMPDCRVSQPASAAPAVADPAAAASAQMSQASGNSSQSNRSLGEAVSQMSPQERQQWLTSAERERIDWTGCRRVLIRVALNRATRSDQGWRV